MNVKSLVMLWIGTAVGVLVCLFPPMLYQSTYLDSNVGFVRLQSGFHRFIFDSGDSGRFGLFWLVDSGRLACYLLIVAFLTFAAVLTLNRRSSGPTKNPAG